MKLKRLSGVFDIVPKKLLTLNSGGMIRLTPKQTYKAFRTDYEIKNQPGKETIMVIKDNHRWFALALGYCQNQFDFLSDKPIENQEKWLENFNLRNEHIRHKEEPIELI